jgi:hypothetical protein
VILPALLGAPPAPGGAKSAQETCVRGHFSTPETLLLKNLLLPVRLATSVPAFVLLACSLPSTAQSSGHNEVPGFANSIFIEPPSGQLGASFTGVPFLDPAAANVTVALNSNGASSLDALPSDPGSPDPSPDENHPTGHFGAKNKDEGVAPAGYRKLGPFARYAVGVGISPLGVGIKLATDLGQYLDLRVTGSFFSFTTTGVDVGGFDVDGDVHFASASASLDLYPFNTGFRISPGLLFYNQNRVDAVGELKPGTSFTLGDQTYYSANDNPALGTTRMAGTGRLGLNTQKPAPMITAGFGSYIPRSGRHLTFPSEFGVIYMGAPSVNVETSGWVCTDKALTTCSNVNDPKNPIAIVFQQNLTTQIQKWRNDADKVKFYPVFSSSIVYSFSFR